ncbi:MAG: sodium:solute symporter family protein [Turneriella sp.]|nr:sodium:solute symporter family protein [Turneriella sp.]
MATNSLLVFGVVAYLLLTVVIGFIAARRVRSEKDFALAGKNLSLFMATSTVFATWFGSETILGSSANFVREGFLGVIEEPFGAALCLILVGVFFARRLYRMDLVTFSDFFRLRYGVAAEIFSAAILSFSYVSWVAAQFLALGIVFHTITGLSLEVAIVAMAVLVAFYTTLGGMWAVSLTDTVQMALIILGLAAVFIFLSQEAGGLQVILAKTPASHFSFLPPADFSPFRYAGLWMVLGLGSIPGQDVFQRVMSSRSEHIAAWSSIVAGFLYLSVAMIPLFLGLVAVQLLTKNDLPQDLQFLLPQLILQKTPVLVQIVFFGALISAILSTASGALLAPSVLISENLLAKVFRNQDTLLLSRLSTLAIAGWALEMALAHRHIHNLVTESSAVGLVALFAPFIFGFYGKNVPSLVAVASMLSGFCVWLFWQPLSRLFNIPHDDFPGTVAGFLTAFLPFGIFYGGQILKKTKTLLARAN